MANFTSRQLYALPQYVPKYDVDSVVKVGLMLQQKYEQNRQAIETSLLQKASLPLGNVAGMELMQKSLDKSVEALNKSVEDIDFTNTTEIANIIKTVDKATSSDDLLRNVQSGINMKKTLDRIEKDKKEGKSNPANELFALLNISKYRASTDLTDSYQDAYLEPRNVVKELNDMLKGIDKTGETQVYMTESGRLGVLNEEKLTESGSLAQVVNVIDSYIEENPGLSKQVALNSWYRYKDVSDEDLNKIVVQKLSEPLEEIQDAIRQVDLQLGVVVKGSDQEQTLLKQRENYQQILQRTQNNAAKSYEYMQSRAGKEYFLGKSLYTDLFYNRYNKKTRESKMIADPGFNAEMRVNEFQLDVQSKNHDWMIDERRVKVEEDAEKRQSRELGIKEDSGYFSKGGTRDDGTKTGVNENGKYSVYDGADLEEAGSAANKTLTPEQQYENMSNIYEQDVRSVDMLKQEMMDEVLQTGTSLFNNGRGQVVIDEINKYYELGKGWKKGVTPEQKTNTINLITEAIKNGTITSARLISKNSQIQNTERNMQDFKEAVGKVQKIVEPLKKGVDKFVDDTRLFYENFPDPSEYKGNDKETQSYYDYAKSMVELSKRDPLSFKKVVLTTGKVISKKRMDVDWKAFKRIFTSFGEVVNDGDNFLNQAEDIKSWLRDRAKDYIKDLNEEELDLVAKEIVSIYGSVEDDVVNKQGVRVNIGSFNKGALNTGQFNNTTLKGRYVTAWEDQEKINNAVARSMDGVNYTPLNSSFILPLDKSKDEDMKLIRTMATNTKLSGEVEKKIAEIDPTKPLTVFYHTATGRPGTVTMGVAGQDSEGGEINLTMDVYRHALPKVILESIDRTKANVSLASTWSNTLKLNADQTYLLGQDVGQGYTYRYSPVNLIGSSGFAVRLYRDRIGANGDLQEDKIGVWIGDDPDEIKKLQTFGGTGNQIPIIGSDPNATYKAINDMWNSPNGPQLFHAMYETGNKNLR